MDQVYQDLGVQKCLSELQENNFDGVSLSHTETTEVSKQVVAGLNYFLTFKFLDSNGVTYEGKCTVYFPPGSIDGQVVDVSYN